MPDIDLGSHVTNLAIDGTYADHIDVECMAAMLELRVRIVQPSTDTIAGVQVQGPELVLGFIPNLKHYVSLEATAR